MSLMSLINPIETIIDKFVPDAAEKVKAKTAVRNFFGSLNKQQTDLLALDAKGDWRQWGWRVFIGWTCGMALFYHFIAHPFLLWVAIVIFKATQEQLPPDLDIMALFPLIMGMLGLSGLRTYEKKQGKDSK